jgi:putative oxidoreductase
MLHSTGLAERIAFGRTVDPATDTTIKVAQRPTTALVGRLLIASTFLVFGIGKLIDPTGTASYMAGAGIPYAHTLAIVAGIAEVAGGLALGFGFLTRIGALGLILFLIPTTLIFHAFWNLEGIQRQLQMVNFMKNLAIMGGLATVLAFGPSRYSIDKKIREPRQP